MKRIETVSEHPHQFRFVVYVWQHTARYTPASFPGSCVGEEEIKPDTHCLRMHQVPLVTCILFHFTKITVSFYLPAERPYWMVILPVGHVCGTEVRNNITLTGTVCIALFAVISELQRKDCVSHVPQHLAGMDECVDNFC